MRRTWNRWTDRSLALSKQVSRFPIRGISLLLCPTSKALEECPMSSHGALVFNITAMPDFPASMSALSGKALCYLRSCISLLARQTELRVSSGSCLQRLQTACAYLKSQTQIKHKLQVLSTVVGPFHQCPFLQVFRCCLVNFVLSSRYTRAGTESRAEVRRVGRMMISVVLCWCNIRSLGWDTSLPQYHTTTTSLSLGRRNELDCYTTFNSCLDSQQRCVTVHMQRSCYLQTRLSAHLHVVAR